MAKARGVSLVKVSTETPLAALRQRVRDYQMLVKFRLTATVVFSSIMAYLIAVEEPVRLWPLVVLTLGGFLTTGAANTLNQVLEKDYDRLMRRTEDRPLAAGRMKTPQAVLAAGFMCLIGISLLALFNPWTAFFGMFALVSYAFVYTPMKRVSPDAVAIGALPGALPMLIGVAAAQAEITALGMVLFMIQFFWQFPHFYSIGYLGFEDYRKAGYRLVPERDGQPQFRALGLGALISALILVPLSFGPYYLGFGGLASATGVALLGLGFAWYAWRFYQQPHRRTALQMMFYSFAYIPFALIFFYLDKIL